MKTCGQPVLGGETFVDLDSRYELLETLGNGSFAKVYRARDRELGREVAIKQIHEQYLQDPSQLERFWQEAQLLASRCSLNWQGASQVLTHAVTSGPISADTR